MITFAVPFVLGIVGTLLIEWRFRPQFERKRRAQERWENELRELLELLEIRLPQRAQELNHFLGMAKHHADFEEVEDLNPQQRDALRFAERDREGAQRAYEAWEEVAQTVAVLSRRVARFHRPDAWTTQEASARFYSMLYATEVFDFRMGKMPSGNYEQEEKERRKQLQGWVESLQRGEGRPHRPPRRPSVRPEDLVTHVTKCAPRA